MYACTHVCMLRRKAVLLVWATTSHDEQRRDDEDAAVGAVLAIHEHGVALDPVDQLRQGSAKKPRVAPRHLVDVPHLCTN